MLKLVKITPFILLYFLYGCAPPSSIKTHNTMDDESLISHASNLDTKNLYSSNWPSQSWWLSLEDSQLNQLIAKALKNSPDIQMANRNLEKASAFVMSATVNLILSYLPMRVLHALVCLVWKIIVTKVISMEPSIILA